MLPVLLAGPSSQIEAMALVDSGAEINVLPASLGHQLGIIWSQDKATIRLSGVHRSVAMPVILEMTVPGFAPIRQAFAWCQTDGVPLILGQTNFFMEFDVCFFRSQLAFSIVRKGEC